MFFFIISFPPLLYRWDIIIVSFFIVSLGLKVNIRVLLIVMIIGSHGEGKMSTHCIPGIVLGAVCALPKILQSRNVKEGNIVESKLKCI